MLDHIGSKSNVPAFIKEVKDGVVSTFFTSLFLIFLEVKL